MLVRPVQLGLPPVLNFQFLTLALVVVVLSFLAWRFRRQAHDLIGYESHAFVALVVSANLVALWTLNQEIINYFDRSALEHRNDYWTTPDQIRATINNKHLSVTYLWAIYVAAVIAVGLWRRLPLVRWAGLAILALASQRVSSGAAAFWESYMRPATIPKDLPRYKHASRRPSALIPRAMSIPTMLALRTPPSSGAHTAATPVTPNPPKI